MHYWNYPTEIWCGAGSRHQLPTLLRRAGHSSVLLLSDAGLRQAGLSTALERDLRAQGLSVSCFDDIPGNPDTACVEHGCAAFAAIAESAPTALVALGGGSVIDTAKAIALRLADPHAFERYHWDAALAQFPSLGDFPSLPLLPLYVLPTTAGTGSELGRDAVILHRGAKTVLTHRDLLARAVLLDPELTVGLPASLTAATGLDALTHHLEALCSPLWHPMSEGIALSGIRLLAEHLPRAYSHPQDVQAREGVLVAAAMGAVAFQKGLGGVHALAHSIAARHGGHHGLLNAVLLPHVFEENRPHIDPALASVARLLDLPGHDAAATMAWIRALRTQLGIPDQLPALNLGTMDVHSLIEGALADHSSADTNPVPLDAECLSRILTRAGL